MLTQEAVPGPPTGDFLSFEVPFFLSVLPVRTTEDAGFPRRALPRLPCHTRSPSPEAGFGLLA